MQAQISPGGGSIQRIDLEDEARVIEGIRAIEIARASGVDSLDQTVAIRNRLRASEIGQKSGATSAIPDEITIVPADAIGEGKGGFFIVNPSGQVGVIALRGTIGQAGRAVKVVNSSSVATRSIALEGAIRVTGGRIGKVVNRTAIIGGAVADEAAVGDGGLSGSSQEPCSSPIIGKGTIGKASHDGEAIQNRAAGGVEVHEKHMISVARHC